MTTILPVPALAFAKITFFLLYYQIFRPKATLRYLIYIGGIATAVYYTGATIVALVLMTLQPGETFATHWLNPLRKDILHLSVPNAAIGAGIDLYILVIPIAAVFQLQLRTKQRIGIVIISMTGSLYVSGLTTQMMYLLM